MTAESAPAPFRNRGGQVLLVLCAVVVAILLFDIVVRSGLEQTMLLAPWLLLGLWGVYAVAVASGIRVDGTGVQVQNLLRRTFVPWGRLASVRMRWQIELILDDGAVIACFGGPGRKRPRRLGPDRRREDSDAEADDAIAALRRLRSAADASEGGTVLRTWDLPATVTLVVLLGWALASVLIAYR